MTNWDNEIDDVARQMTAGEPDARLTARVLAQVEAHETPWWSRRLVWAWSPVVVAATAIVAILIVRPGWKSEDAARNQPPVVVRPSGSGETGTASAATDVRLQPDRADESKRGSVAPSSTQSSLASVRRSSVTPQSYVASAFRLQGDAALRRTAAVPSAFARSATARPRRSSESGVGAEAVRRIGTGRVNDAAAQASDLVPPPLEIDPIGVESMEAMETLQVPAVALARIEVPAIGEE